MTEIVIHRCTLRIVRRNGWSWGPEPQRLLSLAISELPELIARRLAKLWAGEVDLEIAAPVRISIPLKFSELASLDHVAGGDVSKSTDAQITLLDTRLAHALRSALGVDDEGAEEPAPDEKIGPAENAASKKYAGSHDMYQGAILRTLLRWRDDAVLKERLSSFSLHSLEVWHRSLITIAGAKDGAPQVSEGVVRNWISAVSDEFPDAPPLDRTTVLLRRLIIAIRVAVELSLSPNSPHIQIELDRVLPLIPTSALRLQGATEYVPDRPPQMSNVATVSHDPLLRVPHASMSGEIHVASALPFLLLGPLSRLGYLEALSANLEAAGLLQLSPIFATALAYKTLDPPERGWRRKPSSVTAAAAFASVAHPLGDTELAEFDRRISDHLSPLDAALTGPLIEGHDSSQPFLLHRAESGIESGYLLLDVEGLFPLAWAIEPSGLFPLMQKSAASHLLIPQEIAEPTLLRQLDEAGLVFITAAPPTRGEYWRAIRRGADRWWTNDETSSESTLATRGARLENSAAEAAELWQTLSIDRPMLRADKVSAFDRHLTHATAVALGTMAWELWRHRETTTPNLALERFRDLDARVIYTADSVRVSLPLGRRHQDLREHALLEDVRDVPWLAGRPLQFSGG